MNLLLYSPIYALISYGIIKMQRRNHFIQENIGDLVHVFDHEAFQVFKEVEILNSKGTRKRGDATFVVIFHAPRASVKKVIKRTNLTMPFFAGLPGFCNKKFMANEQKGMFSGYYEWSSVDRAKKYARSYAVWFMKKRSRPLPLRYQIIDNRTGEVIEMKRLG